MRLNVAAIQLNCDKDMEKNLEVAESLIREVVEKENAQLVALPENAIVMEENFPSLKAASYTQEEHPALKVFQDLAKELKIWIHIGSIATIVPGEEKLANRSYLIDDQGQVQSIYDKIHLFDSELSLQESYRESERFVPGKKAVVADSPWGKIGMSVCYDVRFPHLYRTLAQRGAEIIMIPSAFAQTTGKSHWHILIQARAIEHGCFVIAANQTGNHPGNRQTFGHSLIVNPWGDIVAEAGVEVGYITASLEMDEVRETRKKLPSLLHDRDYE